MYPTAYYTLLGTQYTHMAYFIHQLDALYHTWYVETDVTTINARVYVTTTKSSWFACRMPKRIRQRLLASFLDGRDSAATSSRRQLSRMRVCQSKFTVFDMQVLISLGFII